MSKPDVPQPSKPEPDAQHPFNAADLWKHPPASVYRVRGNTGPTWRPDGEEGGSGFAIESSTENGQHSCIIATNHHVAGVITSGLKVKPLGGSEIKATRVFTDMERDIDLVRVDNMPDPAKNCQPWKLSDKFASEYDKVVRLSPYPKPSSSKGEVWGHVEVIDSKPKAVLQSIAPQASNNPDKMMTFMEMSGRSGNSGSPIGDGTNTAFGMLTIAGHADILDEKRKHKIGTLSWTLATPSQFIKEDLNLYHQGKTLRDANRSG